jgi:rod shape-determining protein MreC
LVIRLSPARRAALHRVFFPLLVTLSAMVIIIGKVDRVAFEPLRISAMDAAAPLLQVLSRPTALFDNAFEVARGTVWVYRENGRLKQENERLLGWQQVALKLSVENAQFRDQLRVAPDPSISFVTARVIASSGGAYVRSIMVDAGRGNGVARGQAAITGEGLIGRVTEVGTRAARILLITDLNSRVPVFVGGSRRQAVLAGDNSERPSLYYLEAGSTIRIGDRIVTSGQGGIFPPGLPVGVVAALDGDVPLVEPYVGLSQLDYVRLVDYGLANGLPDPLPFARRADRGARSSDGSRRSGAERETSRAVLSSYAGP